MYVLCTCVIPYAVVSTVWYTCGMTDKSKYSAASKARWSNVPKEERARRMSITATARWSKATKEQRMAQYLKMVANKKYETRENKEGQEDG